MNDLKSSVIRTFARVIRPEDAKAMLATSVGNRKIRAWHVNMLAAAQKRGEWRLTHQGIAFDCNGALRDGHHRLTACVQSGVAISTTVTVGLAPDACDVMDQGIIRNVSDVTGWDKRIAEPIRLATHIARSNPKVTIDQIRQVADGGIGDVVTALVEYCGSARRFYSSAAMKLAAAATIMNGGRLEFVLGQYRALCVLDFDAMTQCSKALVRQVDSFKARATEVNESLARGLRVFDEDRASLTKVQVSEADKAASVEMVRMLLLQSIGEAPQKPHRRVAARPSNASDALATAIP